MNNNQWKLKNKNEKEEICFMNKITIENKVLSLSDAKKISQDAIYNNQNFKKIQQELKRLAKT